MSLSSDTACATCFGETALEIKSGASVPRGAAAAERAARGRRRRGQGPDLSWLMCWEEHKQVSMALPPALCSPRNTWLVGSKGRTLPVGPDRTRTAGTSVAGTHRLPRL